MIQRQRTLNHSAARKTDQADAVSFGSLQQPSNLALGFLQTIWRYILGIHAVGGVQSSNDVDAAAMHRLQSRPPLRAGNRQNSKSEKSQEKKGPQDCLRAA